MCSGSRCGRDALAPAGATRARQGTDHGQAFVFRFIGGAGAYGRLARTHDGLDQLAVVYRPWRHAGTADPCRMAMVAPRERGAICLVLRGWLHQPIAGHILLSRQFHATLRDKGVEHFVELPHQVGFGMQQEGAVCLNGAYAFFLDVT